MFYSVLASRRALNASILMTAVLGAAAHAQQSPALDRFSIAAGGFNVEPKIHAEGDTQYGHVETPEAKMGHTTLPRVKAEMLIGDSQGLTLDYFRYDKDYNPTFSGQTTNNGLPVSGTATAHGNLKLDLAQLAYRWWLGHGNDVFGIGVGAAYLHARAEATGTATFGGALGANIPTQVSGHGEASESAYAPLLEFGYRHAFADPNIRFYAEASGIKKNGGNVDGHIYGGAVGVEWFPAKQVGVVLDYGTQKIKLNRNAANNEELDVRLTGPSAYVKVRF
jgi:hypothetical protein